MRQAARRKSQKGQVSRTYSVQAPVGGLNRRDPIAGMAPNFAYTLNNFFPNTNSVDLRQGYIRYATGLPGNVNTLMAYNTPLGAKKLFAASVSGIYDVSNPGAVGAAVVTGLTSDKFQHANFATPGGTFLYAVNGADSPQLYDGTTWTAITGASSPAITGVTTSTLVNVTPFKNRLWFVQKDSMNAWYLPSQSIGGAAAQFNVGSLFTRGGYLVSLGVITFDGGNGLDDYLAFFTSEGQVAIYKGTDPASSTTFALVGTFQIGNPIGYRCVKEYKGDLSVICRDGVLPLSASLLSTLNQNSSDLTDNIRPLITADTLAYGGTFGWQTLLYPQENMFIVNVPATGGRQYVMNTITGAWASFSGWAAFCFERKGEDVYFGANGYVAKIWGVYSDDGTNIQGDALQAFNYFGSHTQLKHFKMMRPQIFSNGIPLVKLAVNVDYHLDTPYNALSFTSLSGSTWDTSLWDIGLWASDGETRNEWQYAGNIGYSGAAYMFALTRSQSLKWIATDFVYESGSVL